MPGMARHAFVVILLLGASLGACTRDERHPGKSGAVRSSSPVAQPIAPSHHPLGPSSEEMKDLLNDETLDRYLAYEKALVAAMGPAGPHVPSGARKDEPKGKKAPEAAAGAGRGSKIVAAEQAALEQSRLGRDQVSKLGRVVSAYYSRAFLLVAAIKRAEAVKARNQASKAQGKEPSPLEAAMGNSLGEQTERLARLRRDYAERYGEATIALFTRHEADFFALAEHRLAGPQTPPPTAP
jgi:hypothetical protein